MLCWIWRGWSELSSPFRRTNVITLWVWNMHECLEQFKHWRKCKLNDVSWVAQRLSVCNRKYRLQRMSFAFGSAKDQVGRRDSTGAIKAIWDTAHHPSLGPYGGSQHVLTPVWGVRVCSLQKAKFFLHREYVISYRSSPVPFHPCEYYVTMETALKLLWNL